MDACTIIAKNYIAFARVLARSFAEHNPSGRFSVLVIDDLDGYVDPQAEPFEVLTPHDIDCPPFDAMAARYDVLELSTAVKPWLLRSLLKRGSQAITYLDPDIQVFDSLERLDELARAHGLVLIPHNTRPIPDDGERPSQLDIMVAGVFNLGYVTLAQGEDTEHLLEWWSERLLRDCIVDPVYGYFVDQRWMDLIPGLVADYAVVREPECNIAYWNIHERDLTYEDGRYLVNGRPLAFFHFSGFDPDLPEVLSRHQTRIKMQERPALGRICREYAEALNANGHRTARTWPYTYGVLPDGTPFTGTLRRLFREAEKRGELGVPPFDENGCRAFLDWVTGEDDDAPDGVTRLWASVYRARGDVQAAFPDIRGTHREPYLQWARETGLRELGLPAHLAPSAAPVSAAGPASAARGAPLIEAPHGVNVVGYFRSELGVGEAARQVVTALDAVGIPLLPLHGQTIPLSRQGHAFAHLGAEAGRYPINLICMNADMLPEFAHQVGESFFAGRYSIGLWFWEVSRPPSDGWMGAFPVLDEVWAPSQHVAGAISSVSPVPVVTMPLPIAVPATATIPRQAFGLPDGAFLFLFSFDYRSVFERKNPVALVDAFKRAFEPGDGAALAIKCINGDADPAGRARLREAVGDRQDVLLIEDYLAPGMKNSLMSACDCYVSLHRSEGFGLTMAEAMFLGKPVIATGYSGNVDFMTPSNSYLVDYELVRIGEGAAPYPPQGEWAQPSVEHAATLMRAVFDDRSEALERGRRAAADIRATHSPSATGEKMRQRLEWIRARAIEDGRSAFATAAPVSGLSERIARGPTPARPGNVPREAVRNAALRAMKPFTAHQTSINADVARILDGVERQLDDLARDQVMDRSARLSERRETQAKEAAVGAQLVEVSHRLDDLAHRLDVVSAQQYVTDRTVYLAISELGRAHERIGAEPVEPVEARELTRWELRAYSQNGEDGVLAEILRRLGAPTRYFVEFGIESGREGNCIFLADVADWRGLLIEADRTFYAELERKYRHVPGVTTLSALVTPENVHALFEQAGVPHELDVLSIDVDGSDYWIWEAIEDYRPRVVVIEYNSVLDPNRRLVQPQDYGSWDGTDYFGASLGAIRALGERKGYRLVHTELSGLNAFLVPEELAEGRFPPADEVPVRGLPNYFQSGYRHPVDPHGRRYLDLDTGELAPAVRHLESEARSAASNGAAASAVASGPRSA